jgi:CheY-like chemotaxis protein/HPt (histidine-containing phosphotransfer) domain-containing protein
MSHEIRTPLTGILGFAEILDASGPDVAAAERSDYLRTILTSGRHLQILINDILDLSKIEAGMMEVERAACSPRQIIGEIVSVLRVRAREKGLSLEYQWSGGIPETIQSDSIRVRQLLMNLIGNAIKFTERGEVRVVARLLQDSGRPQLAVDVIDTGIGIPAEKLESIFEPFVQADNSVTRRFGGTGLGLTISRRLVELLGGTIEVQSELGRGSRFHVTFDAGSLEGVRILEPDTATAEVGNLVCQPEERFTLPGVRILVVDDGVTNRKLIRLFLERAGAEVATVENGKLGVEAAIREEFDLILMDMQMPVMDGYEAARMLHILGRKEPIIALTAHAMKGDEEKCRAAGCSGYLTKPIDGDLLLRTVAASLKIGATREPKSENCPPPRPTPPSPLVSTLPADDPDFREIVSEFASCLEDKLPEARTAWTAGNLAAVAEFAHWLKGTGGTVGFDAFTAPAGELERMARGKQVDQVEKLLAEVSLLAEGIAVTEQEAVPTPR